MGRLEKIVVLTVLFLVAVVLGVALTPTGNSNQRGQAGGLAAGTDDAPGPIDAFAQNSQPERALNARADLTAKQDPVATPATKDELAAAAPAKIVTTPPLAEPAKFIRTTEGLTPSSAADMMFYTWKQGDNFAALATHFYGSKELVTRLEKANEGQTEAGMKAGELMWIPVAENTQAGKAAESSQVYLVKSGDVLSGISQKFYGTSKKWQKILDANRDTLTSPEKLKPGMRLRIPE